MNFPEHAYQPFDKPVQVPSTAPDEGPFLCVTFARSWRPYILGCLIALMHSQTWEGDETAIATAKLQAENLIGQFTGEGDCPVIQDIRIQDCVLQAQIGGDWVNIGSLTDCALPGEQGPKGDKGDKGDTGDTGAGGDTGAAGAAGADGASGAVGPQGDKGDKGDKGDTGDTGPQGEKGDTGDSGRPAIEPNPNGPSDVTRCSVAQFTAAYSRHVWDNVFAHAQELFDAVFSSFTAAATQLGIVFEMSAGDFFGFTSGLAYLKSLGDITINFVHDMYTDDVEFTIANELYCVLGNDGVVTADVLAAWRAALEARAPNPLSFWHGIAQTLDARTLRAWQEHASNAPILIDTACDDFFPCIEECPSGSTWSHGFNFATTGGGFTSPDSSAHWESGDGWRGLIQGTGEDVYIAREFEARLITRIRIVKNVISRGGTNDSSHLRLYLSGSQVGAQLNGSGALGDGIVDTYDIGVTIDKIVIDENTGITGGGVSITSASFCGAGTLPPEFT